MIDGQYRKLGYYDTQADNLTWLNMEQWSGGKVSFVCKQKPHFVNINQRCRRKFLSQHFHLNFGFVAFAKCRIDFDIISSKKYILTL